MDRQESRVTIAQRIARDGRRPADRTVMGSASIRVLLGWVGALAVLLVAVHAPLDHQTSGINWKASQRNEAINLIPEPQEILEKSHVEGGLITKFANLPEEQEEEPAPESDVPAEDEGEDIPEPVTRTAKLERIEQGPILEFVDQSPAIVGGMGTLYLNIDYPKVARDNGIQGLSVLVFVVEKDGTTTDIEVMKSLHPACDSAAVAAVRRTPFKPGRQNGKIVRVKMRLPVRFRLVNPEAADSLSIQSGF